MATQDAASTKVAPDCGSGLPRLAAKSAARRRVVGMHSVQICSTLMCTPQIVALVDPPGQARHTIYSNYQVLLASP